MTFLIKNTNVVMLLTILRITVVANHDNSGRGPHDTPQDDEIATGNKKVLIARVDFPDAMSSDTAWLDDSTAASWLGGNSDPSTQVNAYFQKASFRRLRFDQQTVVPGVVRMPAVITSYNSSIRLYDGLRSVSSSAYDPLSFDLVMIFWESSSDHFGYDGEGYSGTPMVLSINGMMHDGQPCSQCKFGLVIQNIARCLGADYNADAWIPGPVAPPNLTSEGAPRCTAVSASDPVSGCAAVQGDPYDPLGLPSQSSGAQPQAKVKWQFGWIKTSELHIAEYHGHNIHGYGERVRLVAHDLGVTSSSGKLALVYESDLGCTRCETNDWLWVEYKVAYDNVFDRETYSAEEQKLLRQRGAILHLASGPGVGHPTSRSDVVTPVLLDADPTTTQATKGDWPKGLADAPLQVGRSLRIPHHSLVVTVLGRSCNEDPPWLDVVVYRETYADQQWVDTCWPDCNGNAAPNISGIQHSPESICAGQAAEVTCSASDLETPEDLLGYEWDMGDGQAPWNSESERTRTWTWYDPGTYTVTCTVWDGSAMQTTASTSVVVAEYNSWPPGAQSPCPPRNFTAESPVRVCPVVTTSTTTPAPPSCEHACEESMQSWEMKCGWQICLGCNSCLRNVVTSTSAPLEEAMLDSSGHLDGRGIFFVVLLAARVRA
jgi:hypothetical protein